MPSTFPRSERSRQSRDSLDSQFSSANSYLEDGPRSNLDSVRYAECIHYLQEVRFVLLQRCSYFSLLAQTLAYKVYPRVFFTLSRLCVPVITERPKFCSWHPAHHCDDHFLQWQLKPQTLFRFWFAQVLLNLFQDCMVCPSPFEFVINGFFRILAVCSPTNACFHVQAWPLCRSMLSILSIQ